MICPKCTINVRIDSGIHKPYFDFRVIIFTMVVMKRLLNIVFLNGCIAGLLFAQRLPVQSFTTKDGLASNIVTMIYQDSKGYLWVGTDEGVSIFDGDKFKNIRFDDSRIFGYVNDMVESRRSPEVMWIATNGGGLVRYAAGEVTVFSLGEDPAANAINSLVEMNDGSVWCATDAGLFHFQNGTSEQLTRSRKNSYTKFTKGLDGTIWCYDDRSLQIFQPDRRQLIAPGIPGLPRDSIIYVSALSDSSVAVHSQGNKGAVVTIVKSDSIIKRIAVPSSSAVFTVLSANGQYWIGTPDGLNVYRDGGTVPFFWIYTTTNGLPINELIIGFQDREQNIWFGSFGRGLTKLETQRSTQFSFPGMSGKGTSDSFGHMWIPSSHGLYELWKDSVGLWKRYLHVIRVNGSAVAPVAAAADSQQNLWITTSAGSLIYFTVTRASRSHSSLKEKFTLSEANGYPKALTITLMVDSKNILWYCLHNGGTIGVEYSRTPRMIASFRYPDDTKLRDIRAMYEDRSGNLWMMGFEPDNRIVKRVNGNFVLDSTDALLSRLPNVPFRAVLQTSDGTMWFGSRYHGLYYFRNDSLRQLTVSDGLISNQIGSLAETEDGGILIGTQAGLMMMPDYTVNRFTIMQQYAQSPVHTLWSDPQLTFAVTRFELSVFEIPSDTMTLQFPQVLFTSLAVNGKERRLAEEIDLSSGENTLSIDYTAISFRNTGALRFQYKLEPLEEEWHSATTNRSVTYANLSPGSYVFAVRALNQQGIPSEIPSILPITIASPVWTRWWFIALLLSAVTAVLVMAERFRVNRLLEIEKIRSRIAADLHDDIGSGLTRIALLSDMIHRQSVSGDRLSDPQFSVTSLTEKVGSISRELVDAMSDVVWSIDPKNSSMERLIQRVQTFAVEVCEARDIELTFSVDQTVTTLSVGSDSIRAVLLVAKEAMTNVVRHSNARNASLSIRTELHQLIIEIGDDGKGFDLNTLSRMNGLTNMQLRVEKLGGSFVIRTSKGTGSAVRAAIPLH
jgi:signal transduction histidine kinase/ligand-binding sensor domain-containing protein